MRCANFDPALLEGDDKAWWVRWCARSAAATDLIVRKWESQGELKATDFNSVIWKELKEWLLDNVFFGKCAYCETDIHHARMFGGDAEHFRPKGSVKGFSVNTYTDATVKLPDGRTIKHPGYFWLAYSWQNLMPSCKECNSGDGKCDKLPVLCEHVFLVSSSDDPLGHSSAKFVGFCYPQTDVLDQKEMPLICRPHWKCSSGCDVENHLRFGVNGVVEGVTESGRLTISALKLDSQKLCEARDKEQRTAERRYLFHRAMAIDDGKTRDEARRAGREAVRDWLDGRKPYSLAVVHALRQEINGFV